MLLKAGFLFLGWLGASSAETIHGVTVFTRHGDRTSKHYKGYQLTNLGSQQNFRVGNDYRQLYLESESPKKILGVSEDKYVPAQVYASAPDEMVLLNTATAFLQGLYPPMVSVQTLNDGSDYSTPLNGYQYVVLHGEDANSPDAIWIKGDNECPALDAAQDTFSNSSEFKDTVARTKSFYEGFWDVLSSVYDYSFSKMSYANAFDIFDLLNVASIHNASVANRIAAEDLYQLRTLADSAEFNKNNNQSQPARSIGGQTLAAAILNQLNQTVSSRGKLKFSLMAGSYDSFQAFFGVANLTAASPDFFGLPPYASTMAFELFTPDNSSAFPTNLDDLRVRFLFRNGTEGALTVFPLFGQQQTELSWSDFVSQMSGRAISTVEQWCNTCQSTADFCAQYSIEAEKGGLSTASAGVIGAMVTLGVCALVGAGLWFVLRRRSKSTAEPRVADERGSMSDASVDKQTVTPVKA